MENSKLGRHYYVFTNLGLVEGEVVKERVDKYTNKPQVKLSVEGKEYNFWFSEERLFKYKYKAVMSLIKK